MRARNPIHDLSLTHGDAKRHSRSDSLRHTDNVGMHAGVLDGKPFAGAADTTLYFVHHQQDAVLVADAAQLFHENVGRNNVSPFALNRLHENCRYFLGSENSLKQFLFDVTRATEREFLRVLRTTGTPAIDVGVADMRNSRHHRREAPLL